MATKQVVGVIACLFIILLMTFCAGLQVASLAAPVRSDRFAIGPGWLVLDVIGLCVGITLLFAEIINLR